MLFFQSIASLALVLGASATVIQLDGQKQLLGTDQKIVGLTHGLDAGNKLLGVQQLDAGNRVIGLTHGFDSGNKQLIGLSQFDAGNKLIGLSEFDGGKRIIGVQAMESPRMMLTGVQPAHMHMTTARGFGLGNAVALGGVNLASDRGLLLNQNAGRTVQLVNASPAITTFGARSMNLGADNIRIVGRQAGLASADVKPVTAAVASVGRTVDYAPMAYSGETPQTQVVNVPPNEQGIHINFFSKSSPLTVSQQHIAGDAGQIQVTESEDEPQRLVHNVKKSVIQEVNEVVQPFRVLKQEVKPVIEQAHTLVAEGNQIPLSGRSSGVIATEGAALQTAHIGAIHHQPTQVITAQEPRMIGLTEGRSLNMATVNRPAAFAIEQPRALNVAVAAEPAAIGLRTVEVAQPVGLGVRNIAIAQPAQFGVEKIAIGQPAGFGFQKIGLAQPASFGVQKIGLAQPASGAWTFNSPSMFTEKRHMMFNQPSMLIQNREISAPLGSTAVNTRFFHKQSPVTHAKIQRF